jgi:hypothetical protein
MENPKHVVLGTKSYQNAIVRLKNKIKKTKTETASFWWDSTKTLSSPSSPCVLSHYDKLVGRRGRRKK